jgi:hypothetical protein
MHSGGVRAALGAHTLYKHVLTTAHLQGHMSHESTHHFTTRDQTLQSTFALFCAGGNTSAASFKMPYLTSLRRQRGGV